MRIGVLLLVCMVVVSGCSRTAQQTRSAVEPTVFVVDIPYQQAYRTIFNHSERCYTAGRVIGFVVAEGHIYTDIQHGEIRTLLYDGFSIRVLSVVDIKAIAPQRSELSVYYPSYLTKQAPLANTIKKWLLDSNNTEC